MNKIRALFAAAALLFTLVGSFSGQSAGGSASEALAQVAAPGNPTTGKTVYLPILNNGQASSFGLIDQDIKAGKISAEQGLIYKVFAQFSDGRLPPQYLGSGPGREATASWKM